MMHGNNDVKDHELDVLDVLPRELVALIESASVESSMPLVAPTMTSTTSGYYPSYADEGASRSAKSSTEFNSWEVRYDTLHGCCYESFGWGNDACMNNGNALRI